MKNTLFFLLILLSCRGAYSRVNSLPRYEYIPGDSIAVVISDAKIDISKHGSVESMIKNMSGVNYITYCSNHAVYIFYINPKMYQSKTDFLNQVIQNSGLTELYLKNSENPLNLLNNCQMGAVNSENLKLKYGK